MPETFAKKTQLLKEFQKWGQSAKTRAIQARLNAVVAASTFPAERLLSPQIASLRIQTHEELKQRGERATARAIELRHQTTINSRASQDLRTWLYAIHRHMP